MHARLQWNFLRGITLFRTNPPVLLEIGSETHHLLSLQELRVQDYLQGRKTAAAFPQTGAFGAQPAPAPTTGIFGQAQPNAQPSIFGTPVAPATNTGGFGAFGQPAAPAQPTSAFGASAFGQQPQQQQTSGFGAFGQPAQPQQPTGSSVFGGGGAFGQQQQQPKPAFSAFGGELIHVFNVN